MGRNLQNVRPGNDPTSIGRRSFLERTCGARKVMVFGLGFLGDMVHLLPALWIVRQAYPRAVLHVGAAAHVTSLMRCVPWVDRVWGYSRFPKHASFRENIAFIARLRREHFDALINLNGSDRSSWLTFFSGARERLGRVQDGGGPPFWRRMFTEFVEHPFLPEPMYLQHCLCLRKAGFPFTQPEFHVAVRQAHLEGTNISAADAGGYFHLSPFTTDDRKELPPAQLIELMDALRARWPEKKLVLSGARTERERGKMEGLVKNLRSKPWRVFPGTLDIPQLAAVMQNSAGHLCGDTGTLHVALMTGTPTVSWFRFNPGSQAWIPLGDQYRTVVGSAEDGAKGVSGIAVSEVVAKFAEVLSWAGRNQQA